MIRIMLKKGQPPAAGSFRYRGHEIRRYGLDDLPTIVLNAALLFIVLFYVYPLKFLFTLLFSDSMYGPGHSPFSIKEGQVVDLMTIYGLGYIRARSSMPRGS
jgi:hypothetical protein